MLSKPVAIFTVRVSIMFHQLISMTFPIICDCWMSGMKVQGFTRLVTGSCVFNWACKGWLFCVHYSVKKSHGFQNVTMWKFWGCYVLTSESLELMNFIIVMLTKKNKKKHVFSTLEQNILPAKTAALALSDVSFLFALSKLRHFIITHYL